MVTCAVDRACVTQRLCRALRQLIQKQIELGHVVLPPPPAPKAQAEVETAATLLETAEGGAPPGSSNLWSTINPGYLPRPGAYVTSASAAYPPHCPGMEEVADTRHHRRRDEHTAYAGACLLSATLRRSSAAAAATATAAHSSA